MSTHAHPDPAAAPSGRLDRGLILVSIVVVLGAVMSILDATVVNVAINRLAQDFDTNLPTIQWAVTGYTLALATVIPITGWAADRFGTKRLYLISIVLFVLGSALAGAAWSAWRMRGRPELRSRCIGTLLVAAGATITAAAGSAFAAVGNLPAFSLSLLAGVTVMFLGFRRASEPRPASERRDLPAH